MAYCLIYRVFGLFVLVYGYGIWVALDMGMQALIICLHVLASIVFSGLTVWSILQLITVNGIVPVTPDTSFSYPVVNIIDGILVDPVNDQVEIFDGEIVLQTTLQPRLITTLQPRLLMTSEQPRLLMTTEQPRLLNL